VGQGKGQVGQGHLGTGEVDDEIKLIPNLVQAVADHHTQLAQTVELTGIQPDHGRARSLQRRPDHHAIGVGDGFQQHLAHTTITAHHGHTDRIVHLHPLICFMERDRFTSLRRL